MHRACAVLCLVSGALAAGCGGEQEEDPGTWLPALSGYSFFAGTLADQAPASGVVPFEVNAPLYSDNAAKLRFMALPPGGKIQFDRDARWRFPEGTTLIKTFLYPKDARDPGKGRRILETRLLVLRGGAWTASTFIWNDAQTDATRYVAGKTVNVEYVDTDGRAQAHEYRIPSGSQCKECHLLDKRMSSIGPRTEELNRLLDYGVGAAPENQLTHLDRAGLLDLSSVGGALPPVGTLPAMVDPRGQGSVEARARSWLDANCAHCHNERGYAASTALRLEIETTTLIDLGVCRHPVAAGAGSTGLLYDVVPGQPDQSVMIARMKSNDPKTKMPQLPLSTIDQYGVDLVSQWIRELQAAKCQ